jgi:hypothetical protein
MGRHRRQQQHYDLLSESVIGMAPSFTESVIGGGSLSSSGSGQLPNEQAALLLQAVTHLTCTAQVRRVWGFKR